MKINKFFYLLICISSILYSRGGRGGGGRGGRSRSGSHGGLQSKRNGSGRVSGKRSSSVGAGHRNSYSHGGHNNFNHNNFGGRGYGGWAGGAAAWGLMGGMTMGMLLGSAAGSGSAGKNGNLTIINSYDDKNKQYNKSNYDMIIKNLKSKIAEIADLSNKMAKESEKIKNDAVSSFIKINFEPYEKIRIETKTSNELYGDLSKQKVEWVNFIGDQRIKQTIEAIQKEVKLNLEQLMPLTYKDNKDILDQIKFDLIGALKILNTDLVDVVRALQK